MCVWISDDECQKESYNDRYFFCRFATFCCFIILEGFVVLNKMSDVVGIHRLNVQ